MIDLQNCFNDCYQLIRHQYGVPAYIGARVRYQGCDGVLVETSGKTLIALVKCDSLPHPVAMDPRELEYVECSLR